MKNSKFTNSSIKSQYEQILERNKKRFKNFNSPEETKTKKGYQSYTKYEQLKTSTVFKIIGHRKNYSSLEKSLVYILKDADNLCLENELFQKISNNNINTEIERFSLIKDEDNINENSELKFSDLAKMQNDVELEKARNMVLKSRQIMHLCFSLPNNKNDSEILKNIIHKVAKDNFFGHKYVLGTHSNNNNTHCHLILKSKNDFTKKQIEINKLGIVNIRKRYEELCKANNLNLESIKRDELKLSPEIKKSIPIWLFNYRAKTIKSPLINKDTKEYLLDIGFKENKQINLFTSMYKEHKQIAKLLLKTRPDIFELEKGIEILEEKINIIKIKEETEIEKKAKYNAPFWFEMYNNKAYANISADEKTLTLLKDIGLNDENIKSFLHLYRENKKTAFNLIKNNSDIFDITTPKSFNPQNVMLIEYEIIDGREVKKLPEKYKKEAPLWAKMYQENDFSEITANQATIDKLDHLQMSNNNIKSFLHMYKENPRLAIWTINKNKKLFNITKDIDTENFTLRKIKILKENLSIINTGSINEK